MTGQRPVASPSGNPSGNVVSSRTEESRFEAMPDKGDRSLWTSRASLALGGGMIGLGCVLLVRRYRRYRRKRQSIPENDSKAPDLVERFCTKRQHLLWLLSQDPAILLKNQLAARHLMTTDVTTVSPGTTRERTQELMREAACSDTCPSVVRGRSCWELSAMATCAAGLARRPAN